MTRRTVAGERLREDLSFAAPEMWPLHIERRMDQARAEAIEPLLALVRAAQETKDWLSLVQAVYHSVAQNFPVETRDTCDAGMCGDYREHRDRFEALLAALPESVRVAARKPE